MSNGTGPFEVLFVCTGNICRSPTAEGLFRARVVDTGLSRQIEAGSAGIGKWHVGESPDERAVTAARCRGIDISALRARQVEKSDFVRFNLILAMDRSHLFALTHLCPHDVSDRLHLFLSFAPETGYVDVPDPYYGEREDFEQVLDLIEAGTAGLLIYIRGRLEDAGMMESKNHNTRCPPQDRDCHQHQGG